MSQTASTSGGVVNCEKFLTYDYKPSGNILKLKDDTQFYGVGHTGGKRGVILVPDTWGWNAGRIRNIADFLAHNNMYCAVPQLMGSSTEGGESLSISESSSFGEYMKSQTFDGHLKPKIASVVRFMHNEGIDKIMIIGFSWGGWVALNVLASDLSDHFSGGVLAHPSINLEERIYGGNLVDLFSRVERPVLLMPARGDPDEYLSLVRLHRYKCPTSDFIDFHGLEHGFLLRGSMSDPDIKRANCKALDSVLSFCGQHFDMNNNELVNNEIGKRKFSDSGEFSGPRRMPSWTSWFSGMGQSSKESAESTVGAARENLSKTGEVMSSQANQASEYLREMSQNVKENVYQGYEKTREVAKEGYDQARDVANQSGETIQQGYDRLKETGEATREQGKQAGISIGDYTKLAGDAIREGAHRLGESIKQTFGGETEHTDTNENMRHPSSSVESNRQDVNRQDVNRQDTHRQDTNRQDTYRQGSNQQGEQTTTQWMGEKAKQASDYVQDTAKTGYDKASEGVKWGSEQASQTKDYLKEQAEKTGETVRDTTNKARNKASETAQSGYEQAQNTGEWLRDKAKQTEKSVGETVQKAGEGAQERGKKVQEHASTSPPKEKGTHGKSSGK